MRIFLATLLTFLIIGCGQVPTLSGINGSKQGEMTHTGQITAVSYERKSSLMEDFGTFIVGDIIGEQFGGGEGKDILGTVGGVVASEVYEKNFADEYTKLAIAADGHSYPVYIKGHLNLKPNRNVKISVTDQKITGIDLLK